MVIAVQSGLWWVAAGLLVVLLLIAKSKLLLLAAAIGGIMVALAYFGGSSVPAWVYLIGLFLVLVLLVKSDSGKPGLEGYAGGYA